MTAEGASASAAKTDVRPVALVVDLDGTLIRGDSLWESLAALLRRDFAAFAAACLALFRGRAAFKKAVADRYTPQPHDVVLNEEILEFARREGETRPVILATAAEARVAEAIARRLDLFDDILATENGVNLKGPTKLARLEERLAGAGYAAEFDYIGDSRADRPLWAKARCAYAAAPSMTAAEKVAGRAVEQWFETPGARPADFVRAMRPHQWVKNVLIFLPLFLSHQFLNVEKIADAFAAFAAFSLCASATYIWNDIFDLRADRAHLRKRARPFASGAISIPAGVAFSFGLLAVSFAIVLAVLPPIVLALIAGYIAITVSYSLYLKEKLLLDAMTLALLYGYRIMIGAAATAVVVSDWLIAFSVFFFLSLALVKRYSEIASSAQGATEKISGRGYYPGDRDVVTVLGVAAGYVSILIMALYTTSADVVELYTRPQALWLICFVLIYWLSRVWVLAHRGHMPDDPIVFAIRDRNSLLAGAVCLAAVLAAV